MSESILPLPRPPWEWEQLDLQELVDNNIPEDLHIEYKASRLLAKTPQSAKDDCIQKLTKAVSAFNNADGGVIVIGIEEIEEENKNYPRGLDEGTDESQFGKTWLVQIINTNISPSIPDIRVKSAKLSGEFEGKVAYVIWVPKGTRAVQAKDLLYYQRIEDQSVPMRDFQIQDVNNRSIGPDLRLSFVIPQGQDNILTRAGETGNTIPFRVAVVANNLSDTLADHALFTIMIPSRLTPTQPTRFDTVILRPRVNLRYEGRVTSDDCRVFSKHHGTPDYPPIFRQLHSTEVGFLNITFKTSYEHLPHYEPLIWIAEAPRMQPKSGASIIVTGGHTIELRVDSEAAITLDNMEPLDYWKNLST
jgi:phenylpyruvate tautomerase PptA (4-oxalocrotonate tautomerase family)